MIGLDSGVTYPAFMTGGLCAQTDPELFFPGKGGNTRAPRRVCAACPVRAECLEYALDTDEQFGIWGGLTERQRRAFKRRQRAEASEQQNERVAA